MSSGDYHKNGKKKIVLVVWGVSDPHGNTIVREWLRRWHPELPQDALDDRYPYVRSVCSPIGSWGGGPYRTLRTLCESGVCRKILKSGLRNLNLYAFALLLVWFADADHVRILNYLHFAFQWVFLMDPDPRIWIRVCVPSNSFRKFFTV